LADYDDTSEPKSNRRRSIRIKLPWGELEIRGYDFLMVILVASLPFGAYFLYELKTENDRAHREIVEGLTEQTYVLSLPQDKRDALNIAMPASLKKKIRNSRRSDEDDGRSRDN
jgi:hypothetical protein